MNHLNHFQLYCSFRFHCWIYKAHFFQDQLYQELADLESDTTYFVQVRTSQCLGSLLAKSFAEPSLTNYHANDRNWLLILELLFTGCNIWMIFVQIVLSIWWIIIFTCKVHILTNLYVILMLSELLRETEINQQIRQHWISLKIILGLN